MKNELKVVEKVFEDKQIRTIWDNNEEKFYVSVVDMIEVLTDMMPYIGYPRTLNALAIINDVYGQNTKNEKLHEI